MASRSQAARSSSSWPGLTSQIVTSSETTPSRSPLPDFRSNWVVFSLGCSDCAIACLYSLPVDFSFLGCFFPWLDRRQYTSFQCVVCLTFRSLLPERCLFVARNTPGALPMP